MKYLDAVPEAARRVFEDGWFFEGDDVVRQAATKLVSDDRMRTSWEKLAQHSDPAYRDESGDYGWAETFLVQAVYSFDVARNPGVGWLQMTKREQDLWESDFRAAIRRLEGLVERGPLPFKETELATFPMDINGVESHFLSNVPVASGESSVEYWDRIRRSFGGDKLFDLEIDEMCDRPIYNFLAVLKRYSISQLRAARDGRQKLKKPRDAKADRARFLQELTDCCYSLCANPMQDVVATTGEVLFEDDAITTRLVRVHTNHLRGRDSSEK